VGPPSNLSMILRRFTIYDLSYNSRTKKKQRKNNSKWGHSKELSISRKKICNMFQEEKKESGLTMSTHNFHSSREKKTKWTHMEPIHSYLNIYRHILRSFLHKNENKQMVLQTYNCLAINHKKLKLTLKESIA
jgi:hypothetical protein